MYRDDDGGVVGFVILICIVLFIIYVAVMAFLTIGAAYGAFTTVKNYVGAFADNVGPKKGIAEA